MTYCTHLIFCIDDTQSALEAKKKQCVCHARQREARPANQAARIIQNTLKLPASPAAGMSSLQQHLGWRCHGKLTGERLGDEQRIDRAL